MRRVALPLLLAATALLVGETRARAEGERLEDVVVKDTANREHRLPDAAQPVLVLYETRDSQDENAALKRVLAGGMMAPDAHPRFRLMPVANLEGYDWWPARGYALDAIRKEERKDDGKVYLDWSGALRKRWHLDKKRSSVVLVGTDGKLLFRQTGALTPAQLDALVAQLKSLR